MKKLGSQNLAGGCASKIEPKVLSNLLSIFKKDKNPNLLVGFENSDDACIYKINDNLALVQTLDFFPPMIDNPYIFGQIAATNALSDIYAMGGNPITAMNIVCFPKSEDKNILQEILRGGIEKIREAGASLGGGHSIYDEKIKYGLSVTGLINPHNIWANSGARIGDILFYTKKIGTGILMSANKDNIVPELDLRLTLDQMTTLNKYSYEIMKKYPISSCTDVTGFSFLGHSIEMIKNSQTISFIYEYEKIPKLPDVEKYSKEDYICGGGIRNREFFEKDIEFLNIEDFQKNVLFDPQTSGGLLFSLSEENVKKIKVDFEEKGLFLAQVGEVVEKRKKLITVI